MSIAVAPGEILGLGGLVGSGRTSLIRALSGDAEPLAGRMRLDGREVPVPRTPRAAHRLGIRRLAEDRKRDGLVPALPAGDNMLLGRLGAMQRAGFVHRAAARAAVAGLAAEYGLPEPMTRRLAGQLSGGNQQKLLLARAGSQATTVLLADEPTRGVDIGAKAIILETLRRLADRGLAIVVASSDLEEVASIADRVAVLRGGRVVAVLDRADGIDEHAILAAAFGVEEVAGV